MLKPIRRIALGLLALLAVSAAGCEEPPVSFPGQREITPAGTSVTESTAGPSSETSKAPAAEKVFTLETLPEFSGEPYALLNGNEPSFSEDEYDATPFEYYQALDDLGRCQCAYACVGPETMPTEGRGSIGMVKPTGWQTVRYDIIEGKYLYNRCHLIGYQLTAENANERNLITGTRYLNIEGMLPFENMVADYIKETGHHVLYRVTPRFKGDELVARGVEMEAVSVEDQGSGISFHIYAYNVQPDVIIDYSTGKSRLTVEGNDKIEREYVLNTARKTFHLPDCPSAASISKKNKALRTTTGAQLKKEGYSPCGNCISE